MNQNSGKSDLAIIIAGSCFGAVIFVIIPITYEELMSRLSPYYLVTVNVLITMGAQTVSTILVQGFGFLFKNPGKIYVQILQSTIVLLFMVNVLINAKAIMLSSDDDKRPSILFRLGKQRIVDGGGKA